MNITKNPQLLPETWKLNRNIFFELFLSDLDGKMTSTGYKRRIMGNSGENKLILLPLIVAFQTQTKIQLNSWIISALVASNWSQISFLFLANILTSMHLREILAQFWPNKHSPSTAAILFARILNWLTWRSLRPVQSRGKDGMPRTTRGPSKCYWR